MSFNLKNLRRHLFGQSDELQANRVGRDRLHMEVGLQVDHWGREHGCHSVPELALRSARHNSVCRE